MLYRVVVAPAPGQPDPRGAGLCAEIASLGIPGVTGVETAQLYFLEGELDDASVERLGRELLADPVVQRYRWQRLDDAAALTPPSPPRGGREESACVAPPLTLPSPPRGGREESACVAPPLTLPSPPRGEGAEVDSSCFTAEGAEKGQRTSAFSAVSRPSRNYLSALERPRGEGRGWVVEVALRPGVTDAVAASLLGGARVLGVGGLAWAATGQRYLLHGTLSEAEVHRIARSLLANEVIQQYRLGPIVPARTAVRRDEPWVETIALRSASAEELARLSRERLLSLDGAEMAAIQRYFAAAGRDPTDVELETLAQTWSEHCVHKTFKALIDYEEYEGDRLLRRERIDGLLGTFIRAATERVAAPWVRSAFADNAGIIDFDGRHELSFKVETHNHPSALEPFGGANTGVGGVVRDVIGVSARPIANTDVLCFGPTGLPFADLPPGVLHPRRVYSGVVAGIEDYGNKMGIPTVNGAILFHPGYTANPLVYCGCLGIAPQGRHRRQARPGDAVVVIGGRTGRDGLHGATFSSAELTHETGEVAGGAVQIGNPITEKLVLEAVLAARDQGLYTAITDCGAGGLSSAVGEMGREIGVTVQLERVPLKYEGLRPWEIWLSEAQERMVLAVPPQNVEAVAGICRGWDVEATVIGTFRDDGRLVVRYGEETVADLSMAFLHEGLPRRSLKAVWRRETQDEPALPQADAGELLLRLLGDPDIASKEAVIRRYDHEVQGATAVKPLVGRRNDGPGDATVLVPLAALWEGQAPAAPHPDPLPRGERVGVRGGEEALRGVALGCGIAPRFGRRDPYAMAASAVDEAVRNVVAVGADPARIALLDNFCWGSPQRPEELGALVQAARGCHDAAVAYGMPFISGKDSLNNEYDDGTGQRTAIPPTLLISALGIVPDVARAVTMDLKASGNALYIVGQTRRELGESYLHRHLGLSGGRVPQPAPVAPALARALHQAIRAGWVRACHDLSEGGLAVAAAEMALAGELGLRLELGCVPRDGDVNGDLAVLYAESNARWLVEVEPTHERAFAQALAGLPCARIGRVERSGCLIVHGLDGREVLNLPVRRLKRAWKGDGA